MKLNKKGLLIIISGPSGVGKETVRKALFNIKNHNFIYSISFTTRPQRSYEKQGKNYYFVSEKQFLNYINKDYFLEWAKFLGYYYGTPRNAIEEDMKKGKEVIVEVEVEGALKIREKNIKDAVFIFIVPPSKKSLYDRLKKRGTETEQIIQQRIQKADKEFLLAYKYDYIVMNDEINNAANRIISIISAEHSKTKRSIYTYFKILEGEKIK
ncbi:Guanylate kinase [Candidatus Phytoplasma mali]|uniref:Guanylate kinase n=1 Tax=Phytoplasma mali (strain AT) TaxID=482235 RepID=B3R0Q0_PHYMT|nr:guanylate kinase [Candidatus Phytoplasma mali]CAP18634.1 Guanylate kinase [Candidatus Phytoplasma mali]